MSCHFSASGAGLSNLPDTLSTGAMLLLDDATPPEGHDPQRITQQLRAWMQRCPGTPLLLDFQRANRGETAAVTEAITAAFPRCGISLPYWPGDPHPVFLPPVPPDQSPEAYLAPWRGHTVWLELAPEILQITVTPDGAILSPGDPPESPLPHRDPALFCHYAVTAQRDAFRFTLQRTREDLIQMCNELRALGVELGVGLYQELGPDFP